MTQTVWSAPDRAFPGMLADLDKCYIRSYKNDAGAGVPFGIGVVQGAGGDQLMEMPSQSNDWASFLGVISHSHMTNRHLPGTQALDQQGVANVVVRGPIWVRVEDPVTVASPVFCRFQALGPNTQRGAFRADANAGSCFRVSGARFLTSANAGGLAVLYVPGARGGMADPEFLADPSVIEMFDYGAAQGMAILTAAGAAYNAAGGTHNVLHLGEGRRLTTIPIVAQTLPPEMEADGLNIGCDQTNNDGLELVSNVTPASGRPFVVGRDAGFYLETTLAVEDVSGTDFLRVGFRSLEAHAADALTYNTFATIGILGSNDPAEIQLQTRAGAGVTSTDTTDTVADTELVTLRVNVGADGAVTYSINGAPPTATAAFSFAAGTVVVPFLSYLQDAGLTGDIHLTQWEVGQQ